MAENLISSDQSAFKAGDSCIKQILSRTNEIYKSFVNGFEVKGAFLHISKAFDKVCYKGIVFKTKHFQKYPDIFIMTFPVNYSVIYLTF